ncbi:MAG: nucleotidyltransferase substrate binding protein [Acidobacteria bacterium]|nr:nucleotidyltransferase substrate binding protein [Acidobacteriota bacterium]
MPGIDYSKLEQSLRRLIEQHHNHLAADEALSRLDREARAESVIQRFETCYDCLWKVMKRYLIQGLGLADLPNSPRPLFRIAAENRVFESPVEQWLRYVEARVDTAHDYDGKKARACLELIPDFITDVISVYETMTGNAWE